MNADKLNLDKLVESEINYQSSINETISTIQKDKNVENALKKLILFCKYMFTSNGQQKKKFLCLYVSPYHTLAYQGRQWKFQTRTLR